MTKKISPAYNKEVAKKKQLTKAEIETQEIIDQKVLEEAGQLTLDFVNLADVSKEETNQQSKLLHLVETSPIFNCQPNNDGEFEIVKIVIPETVTKTNLVSVEVTPGVCIRTNEKGRVVAAFAFLGKPESVLFSILLKLFTRNKQSAILKPEKLTALVTSYQELKNELALIGSTRSLQEIKQSLDILLSSTLKFELKNDSSNLNTSLVNSVRVQNKGRNSIIIITFADMIYEEMLKNINNSQYNHYLVYKNHNEVAAWIIKDCIENFKNLDDKNYPYIRKVENIYILSGFFNDIKEERNKKTKLKRALNELIDDKQIFYSDVIKDINKTSKNVYKNSLEIILNQLPKIVSDEELHNSFELGNIYYDLFKNQPDVLILIQQELENKQKESNYKHLFKSYEFYKDESGQEFVKIIPSKKMVDMIKIDHVRQKNLGYQYD